MFSTLMEIHKAGKFVSLYDNLDRPSKFHYGCILAVNEEELLIFELSTSGTPDGIILLSTSDVYRADIDSQYQRRMELLAESCDKPTIPIIDEEIRRSFLRYISSEGRIATLSIDDEVISGFITAVSENTCTIKQIDFYGRLDGISSLRIDVITSISFDSEEEQELNIIWNKQN